MVGLSCLQMLVRRRRYVPPGEDEMVDTAVRLEHLNRTEAAQRCRVPVFDKLRAPMWPTNRRA